MMTSVVSRLALGQRIRRCLLDNSKAFRNTRRFRSDEAPSVKPRTQEEIGQWVKKEMEGMQSQGYGHAPFDKFMDAFTFHWGCVFTIITLVPTVWYFYYIPDWKRQDWAQREAFLVLRERESKGIIPISRDLVDPSEFELPTEEELGDTPIVI